jgi:vacuolar-type H+-ATPase subunit C/Vma6
VTWGPLVARAGGLATRSISAAALDAIDRAAHPGALVSALASAGITVPHEADLVELIERFVRDRSATELAILRRWARNRDDALAVILADEDRRSLRSIVRGLVAAAPPRRRLEGTVPTPGLPQAVLATLSRATTLPEIAEVLVRRGHPLASALVPPKTKAEHSSIDLFGIEIALSRAFADHARASLTAGAAMQVHVAQVIDVENLTSALLLAARGGDVRVEPLFLDGGARIDRDTFVTAAAGPIEVTRDRLAEAMAGAPLATAVFAASPSAIEDAALAWHLATQTHLRFTEPAGLAAVLCLVLRRRIEARHLRRAAWRVAFGGWS